MKQGLRLPTRKCGKPVVVKRAKSVVQHQSRDASAGKMVRTKADGGCAATRKVVAARAPRKSLGSSAGTSGSSSSASPSGKGKYAGGNAVCQRPIPDWQKGIGSFMVQSDKNKEIATDSQSSSSSTSNNSDEIEVLEEESEEGPSGSSD